MTTNVIDKKNKIIASDSRWSVMDGNLHYFVDDTGFDKIADRQLGSIICAGDAVLIEEWKNWFGEKVLNVGALPRTERMEGAEQRSIVISFLLKPGGQMPYSVGWYSTFGDDALFSGTGADFALQCYSVNRCAVTSVSTAARSDSATGGETKFVELTTFRHNLSAPGVTLDDARQQLLARGFAMDTTTNKIVRIKDMTATAANGTMRAIASGEKSLSAPTGRPARAWTAAEREEMKKAMERLAAMEEQAAND